MEDREHDHKVAPILEEYRIRKAKDSSSSSPTFDDWKGQRVFSDLNKRLSNGKEESPPQSELLRFVPFVRFCCLRFSLLSNNQALHADGTRARVRASTSAQGEPSGPRCSTSAIRRRSSTRCSSLSGN